MDPRYFRKLTDEANQGQKDRESAAREQRIQKRVNDAVATAPRVAEDAAREGKSRAVVFEFETSTETKEVTQVSDEIQEIVKRLNEHFTNKGFKVSLEGPAVDGGPSKVYYWWGVTIAW